MYPTFGPLTWITPYGLMLIMALVASWFYARRRAAVSGIDTSHIDLSVPLVFAVSLLGAEIFTVLSPRDTEFAGEIIRTQSRFRLFGLLLIGVPTLYGYSRIAKLSFRRLIDLFALPALLWLAIVRIGCFMAGCCWGDLTFEHAGLTGITDPQLARQVLTLPWLAVDQLPVAMSFPAGSFAHQQHLALDLINPGTLTSLPIHPTQLYELALLLVLLVALRSREGRRMSPGMLALVALGAYCVLRFLIEYLRADNVLLAGDLTLNQWFCIVLFIGSVTAVPIIKRLAARLPAS